MLALPAATLVLTEGRATLQLAALFYVVAFVLSALHPTVSLTCSLLFTMVPITVFGPYVTSVLLDVRLLLPPIIAGIVLRAMWQGRGDRAGTADRPSGGALFALVRWTLPAVVLFGSLSLFWSLNQEGTLNRVVSLTAVACVTAAAARTLSLDMIMRIVAWLAYAALACSVVLLVVAPGIAIENFRLRGVFENANGLAAFLVVTTPIILARLRWLRWPAAVGISAVAAATGSRAGCAALALELLVFALANRTARTRIVTLLAGGLTAAWLVAQGLQSDSVDSDVTLLRTNDSRSETWAVGIRWFEAHPVVGTGFGSLNSGSIAGLPFELLATVGVVGISLIGVLLGALMLRAARAEAMFMALIAGGMVDVMFEPWLVTGGSVFCLLFWLMARHPDSAGHRSVRRHTPAEDGRPARPLPTARRAAVAVR